jgi:phage/conjugal plasmid C-4 type zinc finger TraR family protein
MISDEFVYNNEEEAEMGQIHAIHLHMNAVASVRKQLEAQALNPSLTHCEECEEPIPEERQLLVPGVKLCVDCKQLQEQRKNTVFGSLIHS